MYLSVQYLGDLMMLSLSYRLKSGVILIGSVKTFD